MTRTVSQRYSPVTLMKWMFLFAAIFTLPFSYSEIIKSKAITEAAPADVYLRLGYVLFCATYLTYILIPMGLKRIRPTTVGMYNYVQPLVASFVAISIGQEHFSMDKLLVGIVIFYGVYLVTVSKSRADIEKETIHKAKTKVTIKVKS